MWKFQDLTGERFGKWTVLSLYHKKSFPKDSPTKWLCRCDCGEERAVRACSLKNGSSTNCGCVNNKKNSLRASDLTGKRFGRLTVIKRDGSIGKRAAWYCACDCGNVTRVSGNSLLMGNTKSCGCIHSEIVSNKNTTHGESKSRLYIVWKAMRQRCNNKNCKEYKNYGGRGISVCDEWSEFRKFKIWAEQAGYDESAEYGKYTIERVNVNGNYSADNCKWIPISEQNKNKTNSINHDSDE